MSTTYVDGFVLPLPENKIEVYREMAAKAATVWLEHGALDYRECVLEDPSSLECVPFPKLANTQPGETVVFAYIVYPSRESRDAINAKVMADPRLKDTCGGPDMPFDFRRMAYGGFRTLVGN